MATDVLLFITHFSLDFFQNDLKIIPWQNIFHMNNVDDKIEFLNSNILNTINKHAPIITVKHHKRCPPWLLVNTKFLMKTRDKAYSKFRKSRSPAHWDYYKLLRNLTTKTIKLEKKAYFQHICSTSNSKDIWKELKYLAIRPPKSNDLPLHLQHPDDINDFFLNSVPDVFSHINETVNYYNNKTPKPDIEVLEFKTVDVKTVSSIINNMKSNSTGWDGLNSNIIKYCSPVILPYLTHIINCCLTSNTFPECWKKGLILPIPKINNPNEYKDLRPITILPVCSKILEKIVNMQLRCHLNTFNIIPDSQSGFRPGHSCSTTLLNVTDDLYTAADQNKVSILTLLDFSKAFDTLNHDILLAILKFIGLSQSAVDLLSSYLTNRVQSVRLSNGFSNPRPVSKGVPQGSILGPLLFIIYTHCFGEKLQFCRIHMYADDTQLYHSFKLDNLDTALNQMQTDLDIIADITLKHSLLINPSKSVVLVFGSKNKVQILKQDVKLKINEIEIPIKEEIRNLGVVMDDSFRYKTHIINCIKRAYMNLKLIYPHRHYLSQNTKVLLCETLVLSHFTYCSQVYGPRILFESAQRIQRVQNACLRLIFGINKFNRISHKLSELSWLNMANRRLLQAACLYHQIITQKCPTYLFNKISFRCDVHNLNLRYKGGITPPIHRTHLFKGSFSYDISKVYNKIPLDIQTSSVLVFKRKLKSHLLNTSQ